MPTDLDLLLQARTAILTAIAGGGARPDYSIDGQSVTWSSLYSRLDDINRAIAAIGGPIEEITEGHC